VQNDHLHGTHRPAASPTFAQLQLPQRKYEAGFPSVFAAICACASLLASGKARAACLEGCGYTIE
jgi:hypothetical protein